MRAWSTTASSYDRTVGFGEGDDVLSEAALVLYERLLHSGGEPADEQHDAADAAAYAELRSVDVVWESVDLPALVHPVGPSVAIRRLIDDWHRETAERHRRFEEQYARINRFEQIGKLSSEPADVGAGATVHRGREVIIRLQRDLVHGTRRECLSFETHHRSKPPDPRAALPPPRHASAIGACYRTICTQPTLVRRAMEAGSSTVFYRTFR